MLFILNDLYNMSLTIILNIYLTKSDCLYTKYIVEELEAIN